MVHHWLVRVHDAAGKEVINERLIRLEPYITFRGLSDALELDGPLLKVKLCMLADTPIARATSIRNSILQPQLDNVMTCSSLVEANLYNANSSTLNKLADSFAVSLCVSCGIEHLAPERSDQLGCDQSVQTSAWQCWPLCSMCSHQGLVPPQKKCWGTPAAAKAEGGWHKARSQGQQRAGWCPGAW
jgi:hypothetical protein